MFSFQSNNFNNLSIEELEKKNEKMIEDIVNQDKIVSKKQQLHINSMCELIKTEINTFQQYSQEQMDITTYIEAMQNILQSQKFLLTNRERAAIISSVRGNSSFGRAQPCQG